MLTRIYFLARCRALRVCPRRWVMREGMWGLRQLWSITFSRRFSFQSLPEVCGQPQESVSWFASAPQNETKGLRGTAGFSITTVFITVAAVRCRHALLVSQTPNSCKVALYTSSKDEWVCTFIVTDDLEVMRLKYFVYMKRDGILKQTLQCIIHWYCKIFIVKCWRKRCYV